MKVIEMEIRLGQTTAEELTGAKKLLYEERQRQKEEKEKEERY